MRKYIKSILKYVIDGHPSDPLTEWTRLLNGRALVGTGTSLTGVLSVRNPDGCYLEIGSDTDVEGVIVFEKNSVKISIGSRTFIGGGSTIDAATMVAIGNDVLIAGGTVIMDHDAHSLRFSERKDDHLNWRKQQKDWTNVQMAPVNICDKAWIGTRAIILKGVTVGEGSVVGAGSVVTKDVQPWTVVVGNPARAIRNIAEKA